MQQFSIFEQDPGFGDVSSGYETVHFRMTGDAQQGRYIAGGDINVYLANVISELNDMGYPGQNVSAAAGFFAPVWESMTVDFDLAVGCGDDLQVICMNLASRFDGRQLLAGCQASADRQATSCGGGAISPAVVPVGGGPSLSDSPGNVIMPASGRYIAHVRIVASRYFFTNMTSSPAASIKSALEAAGWSVVNAVQSTTELYPTQPQTFDIWVYIDNLSNDAAATGLRAALASVATVTSLDFVTDTTGSVTDTGTSPGTDTGTSLGVKSAFDIAWEEFWKSAGLTAAPSVAVVALGGGIMLLMLTKR